MSSDETRWLISCRYFVYTLTHVVQRVEDLKNLFSGERIFFFGAVSVILGKFEAVLVKLLRKSSTAFLSKHINAG